MRETHGQFINPSSARMDSTDDAGQATASVIALHEATRDRCEVVPVEKESSR